MIIKLASFIHNCVLTKNEGFVSFPPENLSVPSGQLRILSQTFGDVCKQSVLVTKVLDMADMYLFQHYYLTILTF